MKGITFLIGNGFDVNVGLETRYSDFYKYFIKQYPDNMIAKEIGKEYEYWSDLEVALGKYTSKISSDKLEDFWDSEDLLELSLAEYLETQMERICIDSDEKKKEIAKKMQKSLMEFQNELPKEQQQYINNLLRNTPDTLVYSFISFNYTNALNLCIEATKEIFPKNIGSHRSLGNDYFHYIDNILHIHGTTTEELILGVNDISQIENEEFINNELYRQWLVKEELNKRFGQNKIQDARNIIDQSIIICVFGMSIGSTDKMWWEYIGKWLKGLDKRRLIIYVKRNNILKRVTKHVLFLSQNEIFERFKIGASLNDAEWNQIAQQIYIKYDSNIFNFKLTVD